MNFSWPAARIIHPCFHTNASGLPLKSQMDESVFKLFFLDVGLFNTEIESSWASIMESRNDELLLKGVLCEQFVAQHFAYRSKGR